MDRFPGHMVNLPDENAFNPRRRVCVQADRAEKSRIGKARTPVPAEHAGSLADVREARHCIIRAADRILFIGIFDEFCRRVKNHPEMINRLLRIAADKIRDIKLPDAVHIVRGAEKSIPEIDVGKCVNAVKLQKYAVLCAQFPTHGEIPCILEVVVHQLCCVKLIVPVERIGHQPVLKECPVHSGRNLRADRIPGDVIDIFADDFHSPVVIQNFCFHRFSPYRIFCGIRICDSERLPADRLSSASNFFTRI